MNSACLFIEFQGNFYFVVTNYIINLYLYYRNPNTRPGTFLSQSIVVVNRHFSEQ